MNFIPEDWWLWAIFCFCLLVLFPLGLLLLLTLLRTKRVHLNTRLLLFLIPLAVCLEVLSVVGKVLLLCQHFWQLSNDDIPTRVHLTIWAASLLSQFLLNSLPLALLLEKFFATVFYEHYEKGQRFLWVGSAILGIQLVTALLITAHSISIRAKSQDPWTAGSSDSTFCWLHPLTTLLTLALLSVNNRLYKRLRSANLIQSVAAKCAGPCPSSSRLLNCRYQLRENLRSLRFCASFTLLLSVSAAASLLINCWRRGQIDRRAVSAEDEQQQQLTFSELRQLFPLLLALLCTLFGHQSLRRSLLIRFVGDRCKHRLFSSTPKCHSTFIAVTDVSSSTSIFTSSASSPSQRARRKDNHSRVSDARSSNDMLRHAHFDSLQAYWAKNGPEENRKEGNSRKGMTCCKFISAPCSIVEKY